LVIKSSLFWVSEVLLETTLCQIIRGIGRIYLENPNNKLLFIRTLSEAVPTYDLHIPLPSIIGLLFRFEMEV